MNSVEVNFRPNIFTDALVRGHIHLENDTKKQINRGDIDDGQIMENIKAEEEVVNQVIFKGNREVQLSNINGDKNVEGGIKYIKERPNIPESLGGFGSKVQHIDQPVDYKDMNIQIVKDRFFKYTGDSTIDSGIKNEANKLHQTWAKNQMSKANVDHIYSGDQYNNNENRLPNKDPMFEVPKEERDIRLERPNLMKSQIKKVVLPEVNIIATEEKEVAEAKKTLNLATEDGGLYNNLNRESSKEGMKLFDIGNDPKGMY